MILVHTLTKAEWQESSSCAYIVRDRQEAIERAVDQVCMANIISDFIDKDNELAIKELMEDKQDTETQMAILDYDVLMEYDAGGFHLTKSTRDYTSIVEYKCRFDEVDYRVKSELYID